MARTLAPAALVGVAYLVAHTLYFSTPFPNTWVAKRAWDWKHALIGLQYVWGFLRAYPWVVLLAVPGARHWWRDRDRRPLVLALVATVVAVMGLVSIGFLAFLLFVSNPFERLLPALGQ